MVLVHSATKGLAAMTLALAHSRGWLDYDERVCALAGVRPTGKGTHHRQAAVTHQAGLSPSASRWAGTSSPTSIAWRSSLPDRRRSGSQGADRPITPLTLGFYEGELLRRVAPGRRSLGQFFRDEIAAPLGLDFYIGLPDTVPDARLAVLDTNLLAMLRGMPVTLMLASLNPRSAIYRALVVNPGDRVYLDRSRVYARRLEVPSGGGVGTARAMARAYSVFATDGRELGLRPETLAALRAPAVPATHGFHDEALKGEVEFSLGFMKSCPNWRFGHAGAYGSPGAGGSLATPIQRPASPTPMSPIACGASWTTRETGLAAGHSGVTTGWPPRSQGQPGGRAVDGATVPEAKYSDSPMTSTRVTDAAIDALYQAPLDQFVARRNALATDLRKAGDRAGADEVKALAKPSVIAWAVNQAWWRDRAAVQRVFDATAAQRAAHGTGTADVRAAADARAEAVKTVIDLAVTALADRRRDPDARHRLVGTVEALAAAAGRRASARAASSVSCSPPGSKRSACWQRWPGPRRPAPRPPRGPPSCATLRSDRAPPLRRQGRGRRGPPTAPPPTRPHPTRSRLTHHGHRPQAPGPREAA